MTLVVLSKQCLVHVINCITNAKKRPKNEWDVNKCVHKREFCAQASLST